MSFQKTFICCQFQKFNSKDIFRRFSSAQPTCLNHRYCFCIFQNKTINCENENSWTEKEIWKKKNHEHMEIHGFWRLEVHTPILEYNKPFIRNWLVYFEDEQQNKNVDEYVFDTSYSFASLMWAVEFLKRE